MAVSNVESSSDAPKKSLIRRMYAGDINFNFIGSRKRWYLASAVLLALCCAAFAVRWFNFGIEFEGGTSFQVPAQSIELEEAREAVSATGAEVSSAQTVGSGDTRSILLKTSELSLEQEQAISQQFVQRGIAEDSISISSVSSSWGADITRQAGMALIVFLLAVCAFIALRFEWRMAIAAIVALFHDLILTAGVYSLVGFEVTPSTVVGLLTILGFSLYDTVVVFDKVAENTAHLDRTNQMTYSEAANLAVNQTLMRSINTSLIALLPVAGLLFVGAGILGVGTIKDLALVLFVGLAAGAYSSLFLATPVLCDLAEREPKYIALRKRVFAKREAAEAAKQAKEDSGEEPEPAMSSRSLATRPKPGVRPHSRPKRTTRSGRRHR